MQLVGAPPESTKTAPVSPVLAGSAKATTHISAASEVSLPSHFSKHAPQSNYTRVDLYPECTRCRDHPEVPQAIDPKGNVLKTVYFYGEVCISHVHVAATLSVVATAIAELDCWSNRNERAGV